MLFVEIYLTMISFNGLYVVLTLLKKWWYLIAICLVHGLNFRDSAIEIEDKLFSWTVKQKSLVGVKRGTMQLIYFSNLWMGALLLAPET